MTNPHPLIRTNQNVAITATDNRPTLTSKPKAKSVKLFCSEYGISIASFYRNIETMPKSIMIGNQRRILFQDEAQWLNSVYNNGGANNA